MSYQALLIEADGYPVEEHFVDTPDGYILKVFRIPGSPNSPPAYGKTVVFIQHGLLCSSADWVVLGKGKAIPYLLADAGKVIYEVVNVLKKFKAELAIISTKVFHKFFKLSNFCINLGYDVWLGNARGNTNSRKHQYLSPDYKEFWDFSWHQIG